MTNSKLLGFKIKLHTKLLYKIKLKHRIITQIEKGFSKMSGILLILFQCCLREVGQFLELVINKHILDFESSEANILKLKIYYWNTWYLLFSLMRETTSF